LSGRKNCREGIFVLKVFRGLEGVSKKERGIALGVFDGVHLGHQALIRSLLEKCREANLIPAALTFSYEGGFGFDRKPLGHAFIMSEEEKLAALKQAGVREVFLAPLTDSFLSLSPADFLEEVIAKRLGGRLLAMGEDGHFGWQGRGDADFLEDYASSHALQPLIVEDVLWEGAKVSSSRIRCLLAAGEMEKAAAMMTRLFRLSGTVIQGRRIGSSIGFPTANIPYPVRSALIRRGVYASRVRAGEKEFPAVTSVGLAPSVHREHRELLVESFLYGFDGVLYGQPLEVAFLSFIRDEVRFESLDELKSRIAQDIEIVRSLHGL
jgi:riboflavin kinase/FMN adenylyltransferase